jgi:hypothetical protein
MKNSHIGSRISCWARRILATLGCLILVYAVLGFLVAPAVLKAKLPAALSRLLGRPVSVARVRVNPFALSLTLDGFSVKERDGADFLGWDRLYVRLDGSSLWTRAVSFAAIELVRPYGSVVVERGGQLNFADIAARLGQPKAGPEPSGKGGILRIGHLSVQGARLAFLDRSLARPFATTLGPVSLDLTGFSTGRDSRNPYDCTGRTEAGETFRWTGAFGLEPLASRGTFAIGDLRLAKYQPYYQDRLALRVADGLASAQAGYAFQWSAGTHVMQLLDGSLDLVRLQLVRPGAAAPEVVLPQVQARGIQADLVARSVTLGSLDLQGGKVSVTRAADGSLSLANLLTPAPGPVPPAAPLRLSLKALRLQGCQVAFRDLVPVRPVQLLAQDIDLSLRDLTLDPACRAGLKLAMKLNGRGTFTAEGTVSPLRPAADLTLKLQGLDLPPLDPYLAPAMDVRVNRGTLGLEGRLSGVFANGPAAFAAFKGDLRLDRFEAADGARREPFLGYRSLALAGLDLRTNPDRLAIRSVDLVGPDPRLEVAQDGSTNVGRALKLGQAPVARPLAALGAALPPSPAREEPVRLSIGRTRITEGRLSFVDRSLEPNAALLITNLAGSATSLSTEPDTQSALDFQGLAGGIAPLRIQGRAVPLRKDQDTDVTVTIQSSALSDFNPYAIKYLGYAIHKGQLDLDAHVQIKERKLQALFKTRMDQFYLGDKTPGPDAVHLPVKLCLAILRDRRGVIDLDLPVDGSLDDPDLHYGRIIWKAVLNVMGKVVASPFTLLAHLGGGQDHDLSFVGFAPGSAEPDALAATKAQALAKALAERPELGLELEGTADPVADAGALKHQALEQELLALQAASGAAQAALVPDQRAQWLQAAFRKAFPAVPGAAAVQPPPPAEMEQQLLGTFTVSADELRELAARRARALVKLMLDDQVDRARLFEVTGGEHAAKEGGSRVYFGLK